MQGVYLVTGIKHRKRARAPQGRNCCSTQLPEPLTAKAGLTMALLREALSYLGFHLCSLLGIHGQHVLVVADGVQSVLVLSTHVAFQGLQDAVGLHDTSREHLKTLHSQPKPTAQNFSCVSLLWCSVTSTHPPGYSLRTPQLMNTKQSRGF